MKAHSKYGIEIYRIVSNKALENESGKAAGPGSGETIKIDATDSKAVCFST